MRDPFFFSAPPALVKATASISHRLPVETLPQHIHEVIFAFFLYHIINTQISPFLSRLFVPTFYAGFSRRTKINWDVHIVSFFQSVLISILALWVMWKDEERSAMDYRERIYGYTGALGLVQAMASGYFLWDLSICILHYDVFGPGMLAHGISAFSVYALGYRPFVNFYAPTFILYELSSPFLNIHWCLDKLNMTGSNFQLYNGILLMTTFFGSRLIWGSYQTYRVFSDILNVLEYQKTAEGSNWLMMASETAQAAALGGGKASQVMQYARGNAVPAWLAWPYVAANAVLMLLNVYWFGKMVETIRTRFEPPFGTKKVDKEVKTVMGRGVDDVGLKSVEVEQTRVKKRKGKGAGGNQHPPPT